MSTPSTQTNKLERSSLLRALGMIVIVLFLQVPVHMIESTIQARALTKQQAISEVTEKWGQAQTVTGPLLVVPYREVIPDAKDPKNAPTVVRRYATMLPQRLDIEGTIQSETRARGIFEVPVYQGQVRLTGEFPAPDLASLRVSADQVVWDEVTLVVGLTDARAIQEMVTLNWDGHGIELQPGTEQSALVNTGFHARVPIKARAPHYTFSIPLRFNGSARLQFVPLGKNTNLALAADWPDPSFQGQWLPTTRQVTQQGFTAQWKIPSLGRNFPQQWTDSTSFTDSVRAAAVGVEFIQAVDPYRMSDRSVKYQLLFLGLTFAMLWLFDVLSKAPVHPMQSLFVGMALCLFYLLELSLSEHVGFVGAYVLASTATVLLIYGYARAVLKARARAAALGAGLALLYGYLFTLLQEQNYALLAGSIGLFALLAGAMYATRKIDWFGVTPVRENTEASNAKWGPAGEAP